MNIYRLLQSLRNNITSRVHVNPVPKTNVVSNAVKTETCGLSLKPLEQDVVELTQKVEGTTQAVTKPVIETAPAVFESSAVSMHHDLNGRNSCYREVYERATGVKPIIDAEGDLESIKRFLPNMLKVDMEFAKLPPLEKEFTVWRGRSENPIIRRWNRDFEIIDKAKVGDIIIPDVGYSYTGFKRELAENWANPISGRSIMYKIKLPKGARVSRNLEHGGEVVMPRNAQYRLITKTTYGNRTEVELEYILPEKDNVAEIEELIKKFNSVPYV